MAFPLFFFLHNTFLAKQIPNRLKTYITEHGRHRLHVEQTLCVAMPYTIER